MGFRAGTAQENSGHEIMECRESGFGDTDYHQRKIKRGHDFHHNPLFCLVGTIGFEPTTPTVSGYFFMFFGNSFFIFYNRFM